MVDVCQGDCVCNCDPSLLLFANHDVWRFFIETDTESFQFSFYDFLVS